MVMMIAPMCGRITPAENDPQFRCKGANMKKTRKNIYLRIRPNLNNYFYAKFLFENKLL